MSSVKAYPTVFGILTFEKSLEQRRLAKIPPWPLGGNDSLNGDL
jgi:hypothetical protein